MNTSIDYTNIVTITSSYLLIFSGWFLNIGLGVNNPTWYLCVLLLCYIIYYGIEVICKKTHLNQNFFYALMFMISFVGMYFGKSLPWFFAPQNQRGYTCFFLGVLLYNLIVSRFTNKQIWFVVIGLAGLAGIGAWRWGIGSWLVLDLFLYPALVLFAVNIKQLPAQVMNTPGGLSYQMYLWHVPCFMLLRLIGRVGGIQITHSYFTMILFTTFVGIVATFIYKYYEIPVTRWLNERIEDICDKKTVIH